MTILVAGTIGAQVLAHPRGRNVTVRGELADVESMRAALDGASTLLVLAQVMLTLGVALQAGAKAAYAATGYGDPFFPRASSSMRIAYSRRFSAPGFGSLLADDRAENFCPAATIKASISPLSTSASSRSRLAYSWIRVAFSDPA